ncbi:MAG: tellurite resistance protein [Sneathiella sp.]|nr:MAG: tellurite resistance protein [Sneathiella sp.]
MTRDPFQQLVKYSETAVFSETTVPKKLLNRHNTKPGIWGKLVVRSGALDFVLEGPPLKARRIEAGDYAIIEPATDHHVSLVGPATFQVEFYREISGGKR